MSGNLTPEQGHATGLPAVYDIGGEARVSSEDLAGYLGYTDRSSMPRLIERRRGELLCFGTLPRAKVRVEVSRQDGAKPSGVFGQIDREPPEVSPHDTGNLSEVSGHAEDNLPGIGPQSEDKFRRGRGRPSMPYLLNEGQAVLVAISSDTPKAAVVRREVIRVFVDWRAGRLGPRGPLAIIEAMAPDATMSEVDLAEVLGLARPAEMRALIGRRSRDLAKLGPFGRVEVRSGGRGRPTKLHVFGRGQCLALAMAALVERESVAPVARGDSSAVTVRAVDALTRRMEAMTEELGELRTRLADLETRPPVPAERTSPEPDGTLPLFLAGCTRRDTHHRVQASALHEAWCEWCRIVGALPGSAKTLATHLAAFGYGRVKNSAVFYAGLALLPKAEWSTDGAARSDGGEA